MSVFYRSPHVLITGEVLEVAGTVWRRFAIRDLRQVRIVRQEPAGFSTQRVLGLSALVASLVTVPVVGRVSGVLAIVTLTLLLVIVLMNLRFAPRVTWELIARYRGSSIVLFASTDQHEFEQVCRALQRSLEHRDAGG